MFKKAKTICLYGKMAISVEDIFKIIKKHRSRAVRRYKENTLSTVDYAYYNGRVKVLDELKNEIKDTLK